MPHVGDRRSTPPPALHADALAPKPTRGDPCNDSGRAALLSWHGLAPEHPPTTVISLSRACVGHAVAVTETADLLRALQAVEKRIERADEEHVVATYVDDPVLVNALVTRDNGVVFGRRGTGKTHALKYFAEIERSKGNFVVYIDCEQDLGSTEGLYAEPALSVGERATRLLVDVLALVHDRLLIDALAGGPLGDRIPDLQRMLDHFGEVVVAEQGEVESTRGSERTSTSVGDLGFRIAANPAVNVSSKGSDTEKGTEGHRLTMSGPVRARVHVGAYGTILKDLIKAHPSDRVIILIDEWSGLPLDLQPYLAEMLRKCFFGVPRVTVRIAAIPHRTRWRLDRDEGYIGVDVGAELFPLLDLDEFVVFPARSKAEKTSRSTQFFKLLLTLHLNQALKEDGRAPVESADDMVRLLFTQVTALQELVRAAEGVPRDALAIVARAALRTAGRPISTSDIRSAAAQLYQQSKQPALNSNADAKRLLDLVIEEVINTKRARAFLLAQEDTAHRLIQRLVDDRILHIIKKGYSAQSQAGSRFDVLQIDYGCYVHLLATANPPQYLLFDGLDEDAIMADMYGSEAVPEDDYRAIRRAIVDLPAALTRIGVFDAVRKAPTT